MQVVIADVTPEKIQRGRAEITGNGGTVSGNNFSVNGVAGRYFLNGNTLTIVIDSKSWYPESMIESELRKFFA